MTVSVHRKSAACYMPPMPVGSVVHAGRTNGELPGRHLIADFSGAAQLGDVAHIEAAFRAAVKAAGATLLGMNFHVFDPGGGVTGTVSLAESHMSIHTWPEHAYAALDIFMCGACDPLNALPALVEALSPALVELRQIIRREATDL
ncbi:adenosylmethionine decarboxylase [Rhizobium sp. RAF36]|uniref:adenosylmethionine decarboxylase n=1 Tax=Rhizobium sp. RAF36 TaxID=3233055 RepID=UPI003F9DFF0C